MKGNGEYKKLTKGWEKYVMNDIYKAMLSKFPTTKHLTQKNVAKLLVDKDWIESIQRYTWRSARASGMEMTYDDFKVWLTKQKMYDGEVINAWSNSHVRPMASKMTKRIKKHTRTLNQRLTKLEKSTDIAYISELFGTIKGPSKAVKKELRLLKSQYDTLSDTQRNKKLNSIKSYISNDIKTTQYAAVINETVDKVNNFQGKRLSHDQLQRANNIVNEKRKDDLKAGLKPEAVLVGFWTLAPDHSSHYSPGGDPCERHASHDAGYGEGSHVGYIPIPVKDSHMGCRCSVKYKVMPKK